MKNRFLVPVIFMALALTAAFSGCAHQADMSFETIKKNGELRMGLDENFPPMGFRDESGDIIGFDVDLAREVCDRLGIELTLVPIEWDKKEEELNEGRIDCIWNGLSVSEERQKAMLLSAPYLENEMVYAVRSYSDIQKPSDLRGKTIGVQSGSTASDAIKETEIYDDIDVVYEKDNMALLEQLRSGELDALLIDSISIYYIAADSHDFVLLSGPVKKEGMAIGFRKNDIKLKDKVQETLSEMKADGTLTRISEKWFGSDITTIR